MADPDRTQDAAGLKGRSQEGFGSPVQVAGAARRAGNRVCDGTAGLRMRSLPRRSIPSVRWYRVATSSCLIFGLSCVTAVRAVAQPGDAPGDGPASPIQDNSFLVEEAYNQESGVVQHIAVFTRERGIGSWVFTFTQEWPFSTQRHQLSYSIPLLSPGSGLAAGLGDLVLNYRYQALGAGDSPVFVAPRLSLLLPTGDERRERGAGATGAQFNLPVSIQHSQRMVTHWNAGLTVTPGARSATGEKATTRGYNAGASAIWLLHPAINPMLELSWDRSEVVAGTDRRSASDAFLLSPGLRAAINMRSGLQIVPGLAVPIGLGPSSGERALLIYLSLEHPFTRSLPNE
jgi:hypothetical protein